MRNEIPRQKLDRLAAALREGRRTSDSDAAILMQDLTGRILAWNGGAQRLYGYSEGEALKLNIDALVPEKARESAHGFLRAIEQGEDIASLEVKRRTKDGRI